MWMHLWGMLVVEEITESVLPPVIYVQYFLKKGELFPIDGFNNRVDVSTS